MRNTQTRHDIVVSCRECRARRATPARNTPPSSSMGRVYRIVNECIRTSAAVELGRQQRSFTPCCASTQHPGGKLRGVPGVSERGGPVLEGRHLEAGTRTLSPTPAPATSCHARASFRQLLEMWFKTKSTGTQTCGFTHNWGPSLAVAVFCPLRV